MLVESTRRMRPWSILEEESKNRGGDLLFADLVRWRFISWELREDFLGESTVVADRPTITLLIRSGEEMFLPSLLSLLNVIVCFVRQNFSMGTTETRVQREGGKYYRYYLGEGPGARLPFFPPICSSERNIRIDTPK